MDNLIDVDADKGEQLGPSNVAAVNLPEFFIADPALWFVKAEAMFQAKRVKSDLTRYTYIVEHIPMTVATQVRELLINPPETDAYNKLKEAILKRCGPSEPAMLRSLLGNVHLNGRLPSQLLRYMQSLLGNKHMDDEIMRQLWLDKLPAHIIPSLAIAMNQPLAEQANLADRVMEMQRTSYTPFPTASTSPDMSAVLQKISETLAVLAIRRDSTPHRGRSGRSSSRRRKSFSRSHSSSRVSGVCWYHHTFGDAARRCTPPCSFKEEDLKDRARQ